MVLPSAGAATHNNMKLRRQVPCWMWCSDWSRTDGSSLRSPAAGAWASAPGASHSQVCGRWLAAGLTGGPEAQSSHVWSQRKGWSGPSEPAAAAPRETDRQTGEMNHKNYVCVCVLCVCVSSCWLSPLPPQACVSWQLVLRVLSLLQSYRHAHGIGCRHHYQPANRSVYQHYHASATHINTMLFFGNIIIIL